MGPKPKTRSYVHGGYRHRYRIDGYEGRRGGPLGSYRVQASHPHGFFQCGSGRAGALCARLRGLRGGGDAGGRHGYGRVAVPYANKVVTEITCHARGAAALFGEDGTVIDIGGQDTKAIGLAGGKVRKFVMNDKCSAGTGRFLEIMADRLGVSRAELARLAAAGQPTVISNMCTVFAESEVITLVGKGEPRENIARGVIDSVVARVCTLVGQVPAA